MASEIIVVSGLPRSGTSLMMQMLAAGGVEIVTDHVRSADLDNPRGYFELEQVMKIQQDATWLPATRGKAFKMISQLLYHLPESEIYRILFLQRDLEETLLSQETMLRRRGLTPAPLDKMKNAFVLHLEQLHEWLVRQGNMAFLQIGYGELVERPRKQAERVREFLGCKLDVEKMVLAVDPALYRNRKPSCS